MKKIVLLPLLLLPLLTSCSNKQALSLNYGTMINMKNAFGLKELSNQELLIKTRDEKEVFLLAVYQGQYSEDCLCWSTFENVIVNYMNKYHEMVYLFNAQDISDALLSLKIEKLEQSTPYLYVFNGQKSVAKFSLNNNQDKAIFEDTTGEAMYTRVHKVVKAPSMFYVDDAYLSSLNSDQESVVMFMRNGCNDCKYTIRNVLLPYISKHNLKKEILLFDMQSYYDISNKETASEEEKVIYQNLKTRYGLSESGSDKFGYQNGVVPTIQYRKQNTVQDAAIYFNDAISKKDDGAYYISDSFYSQERQSQCKYAFPNVLKNMSISEGVLQTKKGTYYWSQETANKYHKPNFEAFLNYYVL